MSQAKSEKSLYQTIFERLNRDILTGRYKPGQKFPSEAALMKRFSVSRITVGRAVRELQQAGFVDRIAGSGTYVRDPARRPRENLLFGLIIPNLGDTEIFEPICQGIAAAPESKGHALMWGTSDARNMSKAEQALQLCRQCIARSVAGVFFAPLELSERSAEVNRQITKLLEKAGIPVVMLDRRPANDSIDRARSDLVGIDNTRAGFIATDHLLRLGVRRIGFIGYENQASTVAARIKGYKEALSTLAPKPTRARVFLVSAGNRFGLSSSALNCDAFVCANDRIAGHLMHFLLAQNIRIPQDIRLTGIDDVNYASLLPVPLTTVQQPCQDIGETALRVMLERLDRPQMPARDILIDCKLIVRESCGALIS
jgi:DNA-binding LacI/PurR family transcriptional regulator